MNSIALAVTTVASEASSRDCPGVFIRRFCMLGAAPGICGYPKETGTEEDFMAWEIQNGVRGYAVYHLGAYAAAGIRLRPGCKLGK